MCTGRPPDILGLPSQSLLTGQLLWQWQVLELAGFFTLLFSKGTISTAKTWQDIYLWQMQGVI